MGDPEIDAEPEPTAFLPKAYLLFLPHEVQTFPPGLKTENKSGKMVKYRCLHCENVFYSSTSRARESWRRTCACGEVRGGVLLVLLALPLSAA